MFGLSKELITKGKLATLKRFECLHSNVFAVAKTLPFELHLTDNTARLTILRVCLPFT